MPCNHLVASVHGSETTSETVYFLSNLRTVLTTTDTIPITKNNVII